MAEKNNRVDFVPWAQDLLTIVVLSILITAPIGAIGITVGGPRLLSKAPRDCNIAKKRNVSMEMAVVGYTNKAFTNEL